MNKCLVPCFAIGVQSKLGRPSAIHSAKQKLLIMSNAEAQQSNKPNPWRFVRWRKANEKQAPALVGKSEEQKRGNFTYKVIPGETLEDVAQKFNTYVEVLMEANGILNPQNLAAGQLLWIPRTYKIVKGDTLYSLSRKFKVSLQIIQAANGIEDPNLIYAEDIIVVPEEADTQDVGMIG